MSDSILPSTLTDVWDDDLKRLFGALNFKQQTFVLEYIACGVQYKAYQKAYPETPAAYVHSNASAIARNPQVRAFLKAYRERDAHRHEDDKELIRITLRNAMTSEEQFFVNGAPVPGVTTIDHDVRIKAAQALAKLDGHNAAEVVTVNPSEEFRKLWSTAKGAA